VFPIGWRRLQPSGIAAALAVGSLFLIFAGDGLRSSFDADNMRELYIAGTSTARELLHHYRPLGALVFRAMFGMFGLNPRPYHLLAFGLLLANLGLLYRFSVMLAKSREAALLACLLGAYHAHLGDLYYSVSTLYDLLCCLFVLLAFTLYVGIRQARLYPTWLENGLLIVLYGCALASKEIAVVTPVFVAIYECLNFSGKPRSAAGIRYWLFHGAVFLCTSTLIAIAYVVAKTTGPGAMTANPDYAPHLSLAGYFAAWKHYLDQLFYGAVAFNTPKIVLLWLLMLGFALLARRRELLFGWCVIMAGVLPFIFIPPRGFYVMYMTLPGWYLYAACTLVTIRDFLLRVSALYFQSGYWRPLEIRYARVALFLVVAALLIPLHRREKPLGQAWFARDQRPVRLVLEGLDRDSRPLRPGARILFLTDPYDADDFILYFMFALHYRDRQIHVDRVKTQPALADSTARFDRVYKLDDRGFAEAAR
jgi:hypothetical protein